MKPVTKIRTFDGMLHDNTLQAKQHLNKLYSDTITKVAHLLTGVKYSKAAEIIDANLETFQKLRVIRHDMTEYDEDGNKL